MKTQRAPTKACPLPPQDPALAGYPTPLFLTSLYAHNAQCSLLAGLDDGDMFAAHNQIAYVYSKSSP